MRRLLMVGLLLGCCLTRSIDVEAQEIINLDAIIHASPSSARVMNLKAGAYEITPIGTDDGGNFNAWSGELITSGCNADGTECETGWRNDYLISAPSLELLPGNALRYMTEVLALDRAQGATFTLDTDTPVSFSLTEDPESLDNNRGGMSLKIVHLILTGSARRLTETTVRCENKTTGEVIMIPLNGENSWDCIAAGLTVNDGDIVFTGAEGIASGQPPLEALGIFSESVQPRLLPDEDSFIGTFSGGGTVFNPEDFVEDDIEVKEGMMSLRSTLTVDASTGDFAGWFVSWGIESQADDDNFVRDMSAFQDGRLTFWVKSPINLEVGMRSGNRPRSSDRPLGLHEPPEK